MIEVVHEIVTVVNEEKNETTKTILNDDDDEEYRKLREEIRKKPDMVNPKHRAFELKKVNSREM